RPGKETGVRSGFRVSGFGEACIESLPETRNSKLRMIHVDVTSSVRTRVDSRLRAAAARLVLRGRALVSIAVVGEARMRRLNREMLGHDYVTDVLSFDHGESPEGRVIEIVVCAPFARRQARKHGLPERQELARYVVHGALHTAGH